MYRIVLLAVLAVTSLAIDLDDIVGLEKRQNTTDRSTTPSVGPSTTPSIRSTTPSVAVTSSTVTVPPSSTSVSVVSSTSTVTPSSTSAASSTAISSSSPPSSVTSIATIVTSSESQITQTITRTSNGQVVTATSVTNTVVPVTTTSASVLAASGTANSSGLSEDNKKLIGGLVGGIGGALLLGALGFTAWRIWGKKKNYHDDDLYDPNTQQDKLPAYTEGQKDTPFQATLDQYHRPGPVNTAANF